MGQVTQSGDDSMRKPRRVRVVDAAVRGKEYTGTQWICKPANMVIALAATRTDRGTAPVRWSVDGRVVACRDE
jgi:hypothetical protein